MDSEPFAPILPSGTKAELHAFVIRQLRSRINEIKQTLASSIEARNSDTKSSAGDKHETGRAMMQQEIDMSMAELEKAETMLAELNAIDPDMEHSIAAKGSLVCTNLGIYYISAGLGKLMHNSINFFCISPASPLGILLKNKRTRESFPLGDRRYEILQIL